MYLKELTINGFKSFAKKSELEFSTPITAIVGPNGSGKSNVAESFRFVLGEQSVKSLRGKRGEDLIWGGSDASSRANRASVEVLFDNSSRAFALDFDEVQIERVVHRDGQNEYKINGSVVRLKDVHELLAGAHIGSTGHHIISQGEADRVISAPPKERREMIEDALGLKVYQIKKQDAARKLHKTEENITQVESLRREAAPHLKYLKKQVDQAERSLAVQAELKLAYAEYLKREDVYVALRTDLLTNQRRTPAETLESVTQTIKQLKTKLASAADEQDTTARDAAGKALQAARTELLQAERALSTIEGQISLLSNRLTAAQSKPHTLPALIDRSKLETLVDRIVAAANQALQGSAKESVEGTLRDVVQQLQQFVDRQETVTTTDTATDDKSELDALQQQLTAAKDVADKAATAEQTAEQTLSAAQQALAAESAANQDSERLLFEALGQERDLRQSLVAIDTELQVLERDRADFKNELQEAVALIGRGAMDYFTHQVKDTDGQAVSDDQIVEEDRSVQRDRQRSLEKLKIRLEELGVGATDGLLKEYKDAQDRDAFLAKELEDLRSSVTNLESLISDMDAQLQEQFVAGIDKISTEFNRFFALMFGGGEAVLERVKIKKANDDESEVETKEEGVELKVSLPNKRVKGLQMLSGGERALTSIALIFAMSQVNPPPFIILDETDAALDEANSRRYGDMIEALAQKSQLVLITHNRETMSRAGILYGITMAGDGISKVLSVKFDEAAVNAK